jgi:hypothetical protein
MRRLKALLRHHVEADDNNAFKFRFWRRVEAHDQRIVAGNDVLRARGVGA